MRHACVCKMRWVGLGSGDIPCLSHILKLPRSCCTRTRALMLVSQRGWYQQSVAFQDINADLEAAQQARARARLSALSVNSPAAGSSSQGAEGHAAEPHADTLESVGAALGDCEPLREPGNVRLLLTEEVGGPCFLCG